ncbi:MAG TPA: hypothetical protein VIK33_16980 [Anaerolineae bacterium]
MLFRRILPVALTISIGWLVLLSFLPILNVPLTPVRALLVDWAVLLAAIALVLGFINLIGVHFRRIARRENVVYSLTLIASAGIALGYWIGSMVIDQQPPDAGLNRLFTTIILPTQSALGMLLAILIAVAGFRALRVRRTVGMILFVLSAAVVAVTQPVALFGNILRPIREWLIDPITTGSLRGVLLGVALGGIAVGLRLLVGADKPQGD